MKLREPLVTEKLPDVSREHNLACFRQALGRVAALIKEVV